MKRRKQSQHTNTDLKTITQRYHPGTSEHDPTVASTSPVHSTNVCSQRLLYKTLIENINLNNQNNILLQHDQESKAVDQRTKTILHSHQNFLSELKINQDLEIYNYWDTSKECLALAMQFTCCCLFCLIFFLIYEWEPSGKFQSFEIMAIIILVNFVFILPFLYLHRTLKKSSKSNTNNLNESSHDIQQSMNISSFSSTVFNWIIVVLILLGASPILRTLTLLYSQDTIIALVCLLFIIHLFTHDYYFVNGKTEKFNCYLSLNCVIFISALFASRLRHSLDAFVILLVAIELFLLFPFVRHQLRKNDKTFLYVTIYLLMTCTTVTVLYYFVSSVFLLFAFLSVNIIMVFLMPYLFIFSQTHYKQVLTGPWDEASVHPIEYEKIKNYLVSKK
ncbi:hypothetical protein C9374_011446 [Naegleria lovaniensis]|uniref:Phosphatidylinositol N-acetylglucosaminyltransferase n=1 Tax=Naegleria lovaniensis TaxID=51637 RepID=A0AA88KQS2_NAELO|nr:uncharacterized protein C9374_011446 [Naegleria lovaniensis]KAG2392721.1 hypothetical protein C9374_011446 [Naegleria lovaniensis]